MNLAPLASPVSPTPIPAGIGVDRSRGHYGSDAALPGTLGYVDVGDVTYADGTNSVTLDLVTGDFNHIGHVVEGTFRDAVRVAREESAIDLIDMPSLGSTAILRGEKPDQWYVMPLMAIDHGADPAELEEPTLADVQIDASQGDEHGPDGIWDELGYGRAGSMLRDVGIDPATFTVTASRDRDDLVAIVGIERMITFDAKAGADLIA